MPPAVQAGIPAKAGIRTALRLTLISLLNVKPNSQLQLPYRFPPSFIPFSGRERHTLCARGKLASRRVKCVATKFLSFMVLFANVPALAQDWTPISTSAPNIEFAIDMNSIEREENVVIFKERLTYETAEKIDPASGMAIKEKLVRRVMDCRNKTQGMLSGTMRNDAGVMIEMVTFDRDQMVMAPIPPGTLAEHELELVCKKLNVPASK